MKKVYIFDFDGTLVDEDQWFRSRWKKTFNNLKEELPKDSEVIFWQIFKKFGPKYKFHIQRLAEQITSVSEYSDLLVSNFLKEEPEEELYSGASNFLNLLHKQEGSLLCIISDCRYNVLIQRIKLLGILDLFDSIICDDVFKKPNLESFNLIKTTYSNYKKVFFGNSYDLDIVPAFKAGFESYLFMEGQKQVPQPYYKTYQSYDDLVKKLIL